jgi:HK97 family phage major capsid protein
MKTYAEQVIDLENTRAAKAARMEEVMKKSIDEGRSTDAAEGEEFDTIKDEIKAIDADLVRLKALADLVATKATPVAGAGTEPASQARAGLATVKTVEKLEPGIEFARYAMCLVKAKGNHDIAFRLAERHYPQTESIVKTLKAQSEGCDLAGLMQMKATIAAGTTTDSVWASPLVYASNFSAGFIEFLRARTLIGQANFRSVPFNVRIPKQTTGGTAGWVGQGKAKPLTKFEFGSTSIPYTKVSAISVLTQELIRFSDPSAERLVRDSLADAVIERVDTDLFDPDLVAVANVNPGGLLNGVSPVAGPATNAAADVQTAINGLWAQWDSTYLGMSPAYFTTPAVARFLASLRDASGVRYYPDVTQSGGSINGVPLRTSQYLANNGGSGGAPFILADESEVFLADDGGVTLDASQEASLEMSDAPAHDSSTPTGASLVSMWQTNSIALRAERFIWWGARRTGAVQWIDGFPVS